MFHRLDRRIETGHAGHQNDGHVEIAVADGLQESNAVHTGHVDVAHDHVERDLRQKLRRGLSIAGRGHFVA
jgi:hypothetical protein